MGCHDRRRAERVSTWGMVVRVNLDPVIGSEANKTRPAMVVCNDLAYESAQRNRRGVVTIIPITSNVTRVFPFQVLIGKADTGMCGLSHPSKLQVEQIRSVDIRRILATLGHLPVHLHQQVRDAIALHLDLDPQ